MNTAPIALFVYNRPVHTRQTVMSLQRNSLAQHSELFVFSDAARRPEAAPAVEEVRQYIRGIDGFKAVHIIEQPANQGLAKSIIAGVTALCRDHGRVIVLEDDLVTSPHFLHYMNAALERYQHAEDVMQIAGYMFPVRLPLQEDALFLPFISSWGWATWERAWRHFDPSAQGYQQLAGDPAARRRFDLNGNYKYFKMLQAQQQGKVESWAIRWYLSVFRRAGRALFPRTTLVRNLGFDGSGVNCAVSEFAQDELQQDFQIASWPQSTATSPHAEAVFAHMRPKMSFTSLRNRLTAALRRVR